MNNLNARLVIVCKEKDQITKRFLKTQLEQLNIPPDQIYLSDLRPAKVELQQILLYRELEKINPEIILSLGKEPLYTLLFPKFKKNFVLKDHVGLMYHNKWPILACYDPIYIANHTKKELESFQNCFKTIRLFLFGEQK